MLSKHLVYLAVETLEECSKRGTSCKNVLYQLRKERRLNERQWKLLYAVVMQTRKYATLLKETVELLPESLQSSLYRCFDCRQWLLWLFLYDLLLGKNEIGSTLADSVVEVCSQENVLLLRQCLETAKNSIPLTDQPAWLAENIYVYGRVNYVNSSMESVLSSLESSGYCDATRGEQVIVEKDSKRKQLPLEFYKFWLDSDVSSLLVFPCHSRIAEHHLVRLRRELVIQDKASCLVAQGFDAQLGWKVVDACASPGNKSMHLISKGIEQHGEAFYHNPIKVIAIDRDKKRFELLNRTIRNCGYESYIDTQKVDFLEWNDKECQGIILDPSCSGSGLIKRNWTDGLDEKGTRPTRLKQLSFFQKKMLRHALCDFPKCCRVTYSTCSIYKEENEMVIYEVLQQVKDLGWKLTRFLPQWPRRGSLDPLNREEAAACVRTDPKLDHTNGFFVACFERTKTPISDKKRVVIQASDSSHSAYSLKRLGSSCSIVLVLDGADERKTAIIYSPTSHKRIDELPLYGETETVSGKVVIAVKEGKSLQHMGIRIEFIGAIEMLYDRESSQEFTSLVRELEDPAYDTYNGVNVRLRYFLRVTVERPPYIPNIVKEYDMAVAHFQEEPQVNNTIRMEVGIEDSLHIEFEYKKSKLHLSDVVLGKVYFLQVRIKIKRMELEIKRRESAGTGVHAVNEMDTLAKFEIMDGSPVRGESIPVRMFLSAYPSLTPTYKNVNNKFSVKYFLNLVLVDEDDRRYFKQHEIFLWRTVTTS
ncbi:Probable 28S rRNA (cytosine-C(5))-methyltransferase [Galdieria sulphuraria]|nr:Probable 28S rRNA (cytosine-C(5))-methyltransferase [Galdieria sulphuraria]